MMLTTDTDTEVLPDSSLVPVCGLRPLFVLGVPWLDQLYLPGQGDGAVATRTLDKNAGHRPPVCLAAPVLSDLIIKTIVWVAGLCLRG